MLSHHNLTWTAGLLLREFRLRAGDSVISYLPLSHIAEQIVTVHGPMALGATTWFAESLEAMAGNLLEVRPHIFFAVPRVWEKIQAAIGEAAATSGPVKRWIGQWARKVGLEAGYASQRGGEPPSSLPLAEALVLRKVRKRLGLDRARVCAVAAAPTALSTHEFFLSLGIPILEVYGQSENSGPATISLPDRYRTGYAGRAMEGTEVRIAADGEILLRGPHVFMGYLKDPKGTREALDADGWLHTGDVGELNPEGFLKVTDRKKEILITSGGKNISPQNIEAMLKGIPAVAQAAVVGDGRRYVAALLTLDPERWRGIASAIGSPARTLEEASTDRVFHDYLERQVARVNEQLSKVESVKRFRILPRDFSIETGELTPTMKLKRRVIEKNFAAEIETLY
jgi:long-subunit acyl-CoA synthetase (AMP-forming)